MILSKKDTFFILYKNVWIRNLLFSITIITIIFFTSIINPSPKSSIVQSYTDIFCFFITKYSFIFIHNHYLIRLFLFKKKNKKYCFYFLAFISSFAIIDFTVTTILGFSTYLFTELISSLIITIFGSSFYIIHSWIVKNVFETKKELEINQRQLNLLKQQTSPHFLFNALNNLYGVALTSPSSVSEHILQLSDLLRYQVESTKNNWVKIEEEIKFINHFFDYYTFKTNNLQVVKNININHPIILPPLIFLPLIENSIKYSSETKNPQIKYDLNYINNILVFSISNNYLSLNSNINSTKTGLKNLENRLILSKINYNLSIENNSTNLFKLTISLWNLPTNV